MNFKETVSGFRVRSEVYYNHKGDPKKYYIYLNKQQCSNIGDVMKHIKTVCQIENDIEIYIDDMLLPDNETIHLIQKDDILVVKILNNKRKYIEEDDDVEFISSFEIPSTSENKQPSSNKRKYKRNKNSAEIGEATKLLERKRSILSSFASTASSCNVDENIASNENSTSVFDDDCFVPSKKKRKRKHKKKIKSDVCDTHQGNSEELPASFYNGDKVETECISENRDNLAENKSSQSHIYFSEAAVETKGSDQDQPATATQNKGDVSEDIRSHLTKLANKPKSEKVFTRKNTSNGGIDIQGKNNTIHPNTPTEKLSSLDIDESSPIVEKPNLGDIITFTKIKIGADYCPQPSGVIVGKILRIKIPKDKPDQLLVAMEILQGSEEFSVPKGKFSLEEDDHLPEGTERAFIAEVYWHEVIEPCLLRETDSNCVVLNSKINI